MKKLLCAVFHLHQLIADIIFNCCCRYSHTETHHNRQYDVLLHDRPASPSTVSFEINNRFILQNLLQFDMENVVALQIFKLSFISSLVEQWIGRM